MSKSIFWIFLINFEHFLAQNCCFLRKNRQIWAILLAQNSCFYASKINFFLNFSFLMIWRWPGYQKCSKMFKLFKFFIFSIFWFFFQALVYVKNLWAWKNKQNLLKFAIFSKILLNFVLHSTCGSELIFFLLCAP